MMIAVVILWIKNVYGQRKIRRLQEEAICESFSDAEEGYRIIRGVGNMNYVYCNDQLYSIVFSQTTPYKIVYKRELNHHEIIDVERQCVGKHIREKERKLY
jgi:hypothetical protein